MEFNACPGQLWHGQEVYVLFGSTVFASKEKATLEELAASPYVIIY